MIAFINGKVYLERDRFCSAVLVSGDKILATGSDQEILDIFNGGKEPGAGLEAPGGSFVKHVPGDDGRIIDLEGRTLLPGFNDSHMHLMQFADGMHQVDIDGVPSIEEMIRRGRKFIEEHPEETRQGIHSLGWNQDLFTDGDRMPDRHDLDQISTEIPIAFERVCGHIVSTNTKVIEMLGIDGQSPQFPEGEFYIGEDGYPNGIFTENNVLLVKKLIPDFTWEQRKDSIVEAMEYAASRGVTSVQSNDAGQSVMVYGPCFDAFRELYREGRARIRYRHQVCFDNTEDFLRELSEGEFAKEPYPEDSLLTLGPLKLFSDGSLGGRTALLSSPYADDPSTCGIEWISPDKLKEFVRIAKEYNMQVVVHSIGDQAIRNVLDAFEEGMVDGRNKLRHTVIHCQITDREMLERIRDMDVLTAVQPIFLQYDLHIVEDRVGKELASTSYAFGTMKEMGIHASYGTDCPVESCDPLANIYVAVTRKDLEGRPAEGYNPKECVDVYDAVDAYTLESAYMEFAENRRGRIREGFDADLVVLDKDIFTCPPEEIKDIDPLLTMVAGNIVFER